MKLSFPGNMPDDANHQHPSIGEVPVGKAARQCRKTDGTAQTFEAVLASRAGLTRWVRVLKFSSSFPIDSPRGIRK
jgi:hypothetical protein